MKHRKLISIYIATFVLLFFGCEKEYEDQSRMTYFPDFIMEGESEIYHLLGEPYTDGTVTATEAGTSLEVNISVTGDMTGYRGVTVNDDVMDKYSITYSAKNADGFDGNVYRTVYIVPPKGDLVTSIEGLYVANVQRTPAFTPLPLYTGLRCIYIWKTGANTFELSDALGGYYYIARAYGFGCAFQGAVITANDIPGNSFNISQAYSPEFGNIADITDFTVDPVTRIISFTGTADFEAGIFHVQLEQVQY